MSKQRKANVIREIVRKKKIYSIVLCLSNGPAQFTPVWFEGQLYYVFDSNLGFVNAVR